MDNPRHSSFLSFSVDTVTDRAALLRCLTRIVIESKNAHQDAVELAVSTLGPICSLIYIDGLSLVTIPLAQRREALQSLMTHLLNSPVFAHAQTRMASSHLSPSVFFFAVVLSYKSVLGGPSVADLILMELLLLIKEEGNASVIFKSTFLELLPQDAPFLADLTALRCPEWLATASKACHPLHRQWFFSLMTMWLNADMDRKTLAEMCDLICHVVSQFSKCEQLVDELDPASTVKAPIRPIMHISAQATAALAARAQPFQETCRQTLAAFLLQAQTRRLIRKSSG